MSTTNNDVEDDGHVRKRARDLDGRINEEFQGSLQSTTMNSTTYASSLSANQVVQMQESPRLQEIQRDITSTSTSDNCLLPLSDDCLLPSSFSRSTSMSALMRNQPVLLPIEQAVPYVQQMERERLSTEPTSNSNVHTHVCPPNGQDAIDEQHTDPSDKVTNDGTMGDIWYFVQGFCHQTKDNRAHKLTTMNWGVTMACSSLTAANPMVTLAIFDNNEEQARKFAKQLLSNPEIRQPQGIPLLQVSRQTLWRIFGAGTVELILPKVARKGSQSNAHSLPVSLPGLDTAHWHYVGISTTMTPTQKKDTMKMPQEAQLTMVKAMVRQVDEKIYVHIDRHKPRPPADPCLKLAWSLYTAEKGKLENAHIQAVDIFPSAYPQQEVSREEKAAARRAVGKTRWQRELQIRNFVEKPTTDAIAKLQAGLTYDKSRCGFNCKRNVFDMSDAAELKCYPSKDLDEDHFFCKSFVDQGSHSTTLTSDELQKLCDQQKANAFRTLRSYKKVLDHKTMYLTDENVIQRVAHHFERQHIDHLMPAIETGVAQLIAMGQAKIDPKRKVEGNNLAERHNALLMLELQPSLAETNANLVSFAFYGDRDSVKKHDAQNLVFGARIGLPSCADLHKLKLSQIKAGIMNGKLCGQKLPEPTKTVQGKGVIIDHCMHGSESLDVQNVIKNEGFRLVTCMQNTDSAERTTFHVCTAAEFLAIKGSEFASASHNQYDSTRNDSVAMVLDVLEEHGTAPRAITKDGILEYMGLVANTFADNVKFHGVLLYSEWSELFADTINMAEDETSDRTVHIVIIMRTGKTHGFVTAWQTSRERNMLLYKAEAAHAMTLLEEISDDDFDQ